jgi:5-methylcytosine-specific restriction protein A
MIDRADPESAAEVFGFLFRDVKIRHRCAMDMAESVEIANNIPHSWTITLFDDAVRLNVGRIEVLTYLADALHYVVDSRNIPDELMLHKGVEVRTAPKGVYPSVPISAFCDFPADLAGDVFPILRASHDSLIRAASAVHGTPYRAAYSPAVIEYLSLKTDRQLQHPRHYVFENESLNSAQLVEGALRRAFLNIYERNPEARRKCIEHYGCRCSVCDFDFEQAYGATGIGFIHVHHLKPLSEIRDTYVVDPIADLRPICPNCHAMIHRGAEVKCIEDLREITNSNRLRLTHCAQ